MSSMVNAEKPHLLRAAAHAEFGHGFVRPAGPVEVHRGTTEPPFWQEWEEVPTGDRGYASTFDPSDNFEIHQRKAEEFYGHSNFRLVMTGEAGSTDALGRKVPREYFYVWDTTE